MAINNPTAILLLSCPDRQGLVSGISNFIYKHGGNIIEMNEHVDKHEQMFYIRVAWDMKDFIISPHKIEETFLPLAMEYNARWSIKIKNKEHKLAIFVSKYSHCLQEILFRHELNEVDAEIACIISNHPDLEYLAGRYKIPFYVFSITKDNKAEQEKNEIELLENENIDTIVLARYMQVLSPEFVKKFPARIVNIHHSFLPAFAGGNPYKQAYERGVKIIGATGHYVTDILDEGPIIDQDIIRISHKDSLEDLIRKGRDLERIVLARSIRLHLQDRILVYGSKTIIFD